MSQPPYPTPSMRRVASLTVGGDAGAPHLLSQAVLGLFLVALVAVLSLPQARMFDAGVGWIPLWLLALPASAWCALRAAQHRQPIAGATPVAAQPPRRRAAVSVRRRATSGVRPRQRADAA